MDLLHLHCFSSLLINNALVFWLKMQVVNQNMRSNHFADKKLRTREKQSLFFSGKKKNRFEKSK